MKTTEQEGLKKISTALRQGTPVHTTLRNYQKDGTMFWNEVHIRVPARPPTAM